MDKKTDPKTIKARVSPTVARAVGDYADECGLKQQDLIGRVLTWFLAQPLPRRWQILMPDEHQPEKPPPNDSLQREGPLSRAKRRLADQRRSQGEK
jgi:hypothetical protein